MAELNKSFCPQKPEEKNEFERKIKNFFDEPGNEKLHKDENLSRLFFCPHRRQHLVREKNKIKITLFCKDSKIIYNLGRKIKVTPITGFDCQSCPVPEAENRINCRDLGFEKMVYLGRIITKFFCGKKGELPDSPFGECAACQGIKFFA